MGSANTIDLHVGARLTRIRDYEKLSLDQLADQIEIDALTLARMEAGQERIGAALMQALATALDVPISAFFADIAPGPSVFGSATLSNEGIELNRAFFAIEDPEQRRLLLTLARAMANPQQRERDN